MADRKISELSALTGSALASGDLVAVVDTSASETKKLTIGDLVANGVTLISDDTIPGAKILFAAGGIATADIADSAITTAKVADDASRLQSLLMNQRLIWLQRFLLLEHLRASLLSIQMTTRCIAGTGQRG